MLSLKGLPEEEFLEPLGEAVFSSLVPQEGFKFVSAGELLEMPPPYGVNRVQTAIRISLPLQKLGYVVLPLNKEGHDLEQALEEVQGEEIKLLCPVGELLRVQRGFFDISDTPLFQKFAKLTNEEEVLAFASQYGSLHGRMSILQSLSPKGGAVYLESVSDWACEINLVKTALKLIEIYENRTWEKDLKVIVAGETSATYNIEGTSFYVGGPPPKSEEVDEGVFRLLLVGFFNEQLYRHKANVAYGFNHTGRFVSTIHPTSLAGAIWLQLAQSFFGDAPNERIARRCYICGQYGNKGVMRKRGDGEYRGRYYHVGCYESFKKRKQREEKAEREGRAPRKRRSRRVFLVDSF